MRVAHFCDSEPTRIDGVSVSVNRTVALLRAAGHDVAHYRPGPLRGARRPGELRSAPVPLRHIRVAVPWASADPGRAVDVVHVHTTGPVGMAGFRLAADRGLPLVLTWHTDLLAYAEFFPEIPVGAAYCAWRLRLGWTLPQYAELADRAGRRRTRLLTLGRALMARTDVIVCPSGKTARDLAVFGDLPPIRILPTPVPEPSGSAPNLRAALGLPPDAPVILSVGRVTPEKNPVLLLRAFRRLLADRPRARLVVVGVRQRGRWFRRLIGSLGLTGRVRVVPPVPPDEVGGYYRMADVLAFASTTDTQSLVLAEAEAAGLPVVVADAALSDPDHPRATCEPRPESLAAALLRMLDDEAQRERTRRVGRRAHEAYGPGRYVGGLIEAYASAGAG